MFREVQMTLHINEYWGCTVIHGEKIGPKQWRARAFAFRLDTQAEVGEEFIGFGSTMNTADDDAIRQVKLFVSSQGIPKD
jgi:hypothetical protein